MKTTFYCVEAQFYEYGKKLAAITSERITAKKPKDQIQRVYGLTAFKIWIHSEVNALELVKLTLEGEAYIDDYIALMEEHAEYERRRAA